MLRTTLIKNHEIFNKAKPSSVVKACKAFTKLNEEVMDMGTYKALLTAPPGSEIIFETHGTVKKIYPHKSNGRIIGLKVVTDTPNGVRLGLVLTHNLKINTMKIHKVIGEKTDA